MTVSTAGIVPRIHDFGREAIRPKLAISLNASNDELRTRLMPLNKKWNLEMLMAAAREFPLRTREWITFEYVLLDGVNDAPENAKEVVELLRGMRCKVNLIALNPGPGIDFTTPDAERWRRFRRFCGSGNSGVCAASAGAGYLRGLRPAQAYGRDCHSTGTVDSFAFAGADSVTGSSTRSSMAPSSRGSREI